jgi:hypothetical protein
MMQDSAGEWGDINGRRGVAFRVGARTGVAADKSLQIWRSDRRDALGRGRFNRAEIESTLEPATRTGSRGRRRLFNVYAIDRLRI